MQGSEEHPFVSVIIPVYEDPAGIEITLSSLASQTYPTECHEVIVVDNGSSDRTPAVIERFCDDHEQMSMVTEPAGGSYTARNAGILTATGSILSFIDADMSVTQDWLESVVERLNESDAAYLGCNVELGETTGRESVAERYNRHTAFPVRDYVENWQFAPTCCLTVRKEVIEDVGRFDARLISSGDREFGNRVANAGYNLAFAGDITMTHPPRTSLRSLVQKSVRIGRGKYQVRRYYPARYGRALPSLFNPLAYTPPLPRSMADHVRSWHELPSTEKLLFWMLAWIFTLAKAYGSVEKAHVRESQRGMISDPESSAE